MAKRKAREKNPDILTLNTPKGVLVWPHLLEPDHGTEKFPCNHRWGDYKTKLRLDRSAPGVDEFLAKVDKHLERAQELAKEKFAELPVQTRKRLGKPEADEPYVTVYDEETEEDTGFVEMNLKTRAGGERKDGREWNRVVPIFDSRGKPINRKKTVIWGGTTAIINADLQPYFMEGTGKFGLSRRINAVQIIELVASGGEREASAFGFGEEEGWSADEYVEEDQDDEDVDHGDDDEDDHEF